MSSKSLWTISVTTLPEAEEAVAELFTELFESTPVVYLDAESGRVTVTAYCPNHKRASGATLAALKGGLARIVRCGLRVGQGRIRVSKIKPRDWAHSWKRHFKPLEFGRALLIKPSWSRRRPCRNQAVLVLDPGLSFGTGQHPTTSFCLSQLVACHQTTRRQSFLDIGTGSGILAIAAAKLGFAPAEAFDFDPEAVRVAHANARRNHVQHKLQIRLQDLTKLKPRRRIKFDVICANLSADLLLSEQRRILGRLDRSGTLILAGILRAEFAGIQRAYRQAGLKLVASRTEKEWRAGAFRFQS